MELADCVDGERGLCSGVAVIDVGGRGEAEGREEVEVLRMEGWEEEVEEDEEVLPCKETSWSLSSVADVRVSESESSGVEMTVVPEVKVTLFLTPSP